jgi:hypothetical protein
MRTYMCENGEDKCKTVFENDEEWEKAHIKRQEMEQENLYDKEIFIYCKKCSLPPNRTVVHTEEKFRYVTHA